MPRLLTRRDFLKVSGAVVTTAYTAGLVGCGNLQSGGGSGSGPIKIGHIAPRSGFLGSIGAQSAAAAEFAVEGINAGGGIDGREIQLIDEDTPDPGVAVQKAQKLVNQDNVVAIIGEISSASGLAVTEVARDGKTLFFNTGWNSDEGRSAKCSRYTFHVEGHNTMYVGTVAQHFQEQTAGNQQKVYFITSDYAYGHDLLRVSRGLIEEGGHTIAGSDLVPTNTPDYSTYITKIRNAEPDLVWVNLAGADITTFLKQYSGEFGAPIPVIGAGMDEVQAWAVGSDMVGVWPSTYYYTIDTPGNHDFVERWREQHNGDHPDNQVWQTYIGFQIVAQALRETGSTNADDLIEYLEGDAEFDILKEQPARFNKQDHQIIMDMYAVEAKGEAATDPKDPFTIIQTIPGQDLQIPEDESQCQFEAP